MSEQALDVTVAEMRVAIVTGAGQGVDYLGKLVVALNKVSLGLQQDNRQEALQLFGNCMDGLNYIAELLHGCIRCLVVLKDPLGQQMVGMAESLQHQFVKIVTSMENQDYVLLSDLLEYELVPLLNELQKLFATIAGQGADE